MLFIFTDVLSGAIFLLSLFSSYWFYRKITTPSVLLTQISSLNFALCVLLSASYFVYSMSADMTMKNIGYYFTVLLLPIIYAAFFSIVVKVFVFKKGDKNP